MSKQEAIQAMKEGAKVTHRYFSDNEFIYQDGDWYYDENGYPFKPELFWLDRKSEAFEADWAIYSLM